MIPKIVHYCWFGKGEYSQIMLSCIKSWEHYLYNYKFCRWTEENFDVNSTIWTKQAYENKKYAFVSDYVRLKVLYEYGGIYLDTDLEILQSLDGVLSSSSDSGSSLGSASSLGSSNLLSWDNNGVLCSAFIALEPRAEWVKNLLDYYEKSSFCNSDGSFNITPNTYVIPKALALCEGIDAKKLMFSKDIDKELYLKKLNLKILPYWSFSLQDHFSGKLLMEKREDSYGIHHYTSTWIEKSFVYRFKLGLHRFIIALLGAKAHLAICVFLRGFWVK